MKIINPANYPNLSEADLARYREFTSLVQQLFVMMDTMDGMQKEGTARLEFGGGFTAATTGLMTFHLPEMVERFEDAKFRSDCRQVLRECTKGLNKFDVREGE